MHAREATVLGQILDDRAIADVVGHQSDELRDHVAQLVDLTLSCNMTRDAARILNVLLAMKHSQMLSGSGPIGFHMCTAKMRESRRGSSSKIASVGVLERIPPSQ